MAAVDSQPVVVITGASQGIGAGLVAGYRGLGYAVVANSRNIAASGDPMVLTVAGDIAQPGVGRRIVDAAVERFGEIRTVVNNAGIFISKPFTEYTDADYDAITGVNLRGFFEVSRAAVSAMLSGGKGGHLVNISTSVADHADSAKHGIRYNAVALGDIRTPMHDPATYDALAKRHPLGRVGDIDDVVKGVQYLENSPFVTGEILHMDGGQSAGH
jgi:NAD(P)-dependent dehydrogenase (short-subunit alcohol dehydrogenase family)